MNQEWEVKQEAGQRGINPWPFLQHQCRGLVQCYASEGGLRNYVGVTEMKINGVAFRGTVSGCVFCGSLVPWSMLFDAIRDTFKSHAKFMLQRIVESKAKVISDSMAARQEGAQ